MRNTDSQGFPYPEIDDFGNGALQLQVLAEAIDAKLVSSNADYDLLLNPEVIVAKTSADITGIAIGVPTSLVFGTDQSYVPVSGALGITPFFFLGMRPGTYQAGLHVKSIPSGAVTNNTYRTATLSLTDYRIPGSSASQYTESWEEEVWETSTGQHTWQTLHAAFPVYSPDQAVISAIFTHGNTGSTVTVKSDSYFWVARVGGLGI